MLGTESPSRCLYMLVLRRTCALTLHAGAAIAVESDLEVALKHEEGYKHDDAGSVGADSGALGELEVGVDAPESVHPWEDGMSVGSHFGRSPSSRMSTPKRSVASASTRRCGDCAHDAVVPYMWLYLGVYGCTGTATGRSSASRRAPRSRTRRAAVPCEGRRRSGLHVWGASVGRGHLALDAAGTLPPVMLHTPRVCSHSAALRLAGLGPVALPCAVTAHAAYGRRRTPVGSRHYARRLGQVRLSSHLSHCCTHGWPRSS